MVVIRQKRSLGPPVYRPAIEGLPASSYVEHVSQTAKENEATRRRGDATAK